MKKQGKKTTKGLKSALSPANSQFVVVEPPDCWVAHRRDDPASSFLLYNKLTGTFHAWAAETTTLYARLGRGKYSTPEDSPLDERHYPKSELLMLLALRRRRKEDMAGSDFVARTLREHAFMKKRQEVEKRSGKPLSDGNWRHCMQIAESREAFEKYVGEWLVGIVESDQAVETLARFSNWLGKSADIESGAVTTHYQRFLDSVETAATAAMGIPTKKAVQAIYESGLSQNQLGEGTGFRSVMRQLKFDWLPTGGRGPAVSKKKSGIKSKN